MTHPAIIYEEELFQMTGYVRRGDLQRWLQSQDIHCFLGKSGRISVTVESLTRVKPNEPDQGWIPVNG